MIIDITDLKKGIQGSININEEIEIEEEKLKKTQIKKLSKIKIEGKLIDEQEYGYLLNINIKGTMTLTCALTLEDVLHDFDIFVEENIDLEEKNNENNSNTLDISEIIWENIILEIPIRVVKENAEEKVIKSGEGW